MARVFVAVVVGSSSLIIRFRSNAVLNKISESTCSAMHGQASPPQCSTFFLVIIIIIIIFFCVCYQHLVASVSIFIIIRLQLQDDIQICRSICLRSEIYYLFTVSSHCIVSFLYCCGRSVLSPTLIYKGGARAAVITIMSEATRMELVLVLAAIFCEYNNDCIVPRDFNLFSCNTSSWKYRCGCSSCSSF